MTPHPSITISDLAVRLGVSHSTISRALAPGAGRRRMSMETRERIVQAAKQLGYRPNAVARNLVSRRTHSIGIIVRHFNDPFYSNMIQEIHVRLTAGHYFGVFFSARDQKEYLNAVDSLESRRVEGIISVSPRPEERDRISQVHVPVVYYGIGSRAESWVGPDHFQGAGLAMAHLLEAGHRKIGFIGRTERQNLRCQGYRSALRQNGLPCLEDWIRQSGETQLVKSVGGMLQSGYEQMRGLLALKNRPTAVLCHNDVIAIGAQRAVLEAGLRVPEDMALIGFDALREGAYAAVPLTTVDPQLERIVEHLTGSVIQSIERRETTTKPVQIRIEPALIVRESTRGRRNSSPKSKTV